MDSLFIGYFSMKKLRIAFVIILLLFLAWVFFPTSKPAPKKASQPVTKVNLKAQAAEIYKFNCSMCHGHMGEGNGPTAHALPISPPDWTNNNWQSSVTNAGIKNAIVDGGKFIGRSDFMPPHPQFKDQPVLDELVKLVRNYGR